MCEAYVQSEAPFTWAAMQNQYAELPLLQLPGEVGRHNLTAASESWIHASKCERTLVMGMPAKPSNHKFVAYAVLALDAVPAQNQSVAAAFSTCSCQRAFRVQANSCLFPALMALHFTSSCVILTMCWCCNIFLQLEQNASRVAVLAEGPWH